MKLTLNVDRAALVAALAEFFDLSGPVSPHNKRGFWEYSHAAVVNINGEELNAFYYKAPLPGKAALSVAGLKGKPIEKMTRGELMALLRHVDAVRLAAAKAKRKLARKRRRM